MSDERYHDAAAAIRRPLDADPVVRIRPQFGYIDIQGKLGKASVAMLHAETEFVITGVTRSTTLRSFASTSSSAARSAIGS